MKKIVLLFSALSLLIVSFANAQIVKHHNPLFKKGNTTGKKCIANAQCLRTVLQKQYTAQQQKLNAADRMSSVTRERLKSFCGYNYSDTATGIVFGGKSDSAYYVYSSEYGSVFDYQAMDYLSPSLGTNTSPVDVFPLNISYYTSPFSIQQSEMYPDSAYVWNSYYPTSISGVDTFGYQDIIDYYYSGYNITETGNQYFPTAGGEITRYDYYYDGAGRLTFMLLFSYSAPSWDTTNAINFFYNSAGQLIMDSGSVNYGPGMWGESSKAVISYDGAGNITFIADFTDSSGFWQPQTDRFLYYNPDNTLFTDSVSQYNAGSWAPYTKDSFAYTSGIPYFTYSLTKEFVLDTVYAKSTTLKHVSASGLPDTIYYRFYDVDLAGPLRLFNARKVSFTYDTYKNPIVAND